MNNYQPLLRNIARFVTLSSEQEEQLTSVIRTTWVKRRQFIIQPGFPSQYRNYILEGAFRSYYLDQDGKEHTVSIAVEDWFVTDFHSHIYQSPAKSFVEALEDSVILQLHYDDIEALCQKIHPLSEFFRKVTERAFASATVRVVSNISKSAEERYRAYVEKYPQIATRVPQYVLASYLGMSAEFLSKIRSRPTRKS
ncbi:MAG: Crp/Fnr family transcriptional regulator [Bacteroidota bacterium]